MQRSRKIPKGVPYPSTLARSGFQIYDLHKATLPDRCAHIIMLYVLATRAADHHNGDMISVLLPVSSLKWPVSLSTARRDWKVCLIKWYVNWPLSRQHNTS